jgi:hypothetical protein
MEWYYTLTRRKVYFEDLLIHLSSGPCVKDSVIKEELTWNRGCIICVGAHGYVIQFHGIKQHVTCIQLFWEV